MELMYPVILGWGWWLFDIQVESKRIFWLVPQDYNHLLKIHLSLVADGLFLSTFKSKKNGG